MRYNIEQENYVEAYHIFDTLFGDYTTTKSYFYNVTGIENYFNYLLTNEPVDQNYFVPFITRADRRKQIHIGNLSFNSLNTTIDKMFINDNVKFSLKLKFLIVFFSFV